LLTDKIRAMREESENVKLSDMQVWSSRERPSQEGKLSS
jgi:hypothetical protein